MASALKQIQLTYDQIQDRLVLTISTQDMSEFRYWITRRMVRGLWDLLKQAQESTPPEQRRQESQEAAEHVQKEVQQPLARKYGMHVGKSPYGVEPLLMHRFTVKLLDKGNIKFILEGYQSKNIEFTGDRVLFAGFCQLIQQVVQKTDWGITLS